MNTLWQDLRYAVRMLAKSPGFLIVAILTLAFGIGANTAIFSVVNSVLLRPLPYKQPDQLVIVWERNRNPSRARARNVINSANFLDWQEQNTVFEQMAAFFDQSDTLTGVGEPEQLPAQAVSPNLFSLLGVSPIFGRTFLPEDGQTGHDNVVLLSYGLWQRRFGADRDVVGKTIHLDGQPQTIVGVMPRGFQLFVKEGSLTGERAQLWSPIAFTARSRVRRGRYMSAVARLKPGVSLIQAQAEMDAIGRRLEAAYPDFDSGWGVNLVPVQDQMSGEIRPALLVLLGAVGFVLLIACANVANLLLSRATSRQKELSIRVALGASRWRIARQMLTETVLLAGLGGIWGVFLAIWSVDLLLRAGPKNLLNLSEITLDSRVLLFTALVSVLAGVIFGLAPALRSATPQIGDSLKEGGRGTSGGARTHRLRSAFVVAEVALSLVLLTGSGLLIRSFLRLQSVDPGFNPANLLTVRLIMNPSKYPQDQGRIVFFRQLLERVQALPGVQSVSANSFLPFTGLGAATAFQIVGRPELPIAQQPVLDVRVVEPNYFRTMGIPLLRGREFTERESSEAMHVVIINQTMAQQHWPNEDPIGKKVIIAMKDTNEPSEIIGVVGDVKHAGLDSVPRAMSYWPHPELPYPFMTLVVRSSSDPSQLASAVREEVQRLDKDQPLSNIATMEQLLSDSIARSRFSTLLLGIFSGVALLLATVGIYGVMSYSVSQRTREIGIRMALGAQPGDVSRMVISDGLGVALLGIGVGLVAAFALTRLLASLLFQVPATDPVTFLGVVVFLAAVAVAACAIPAWRATRVDPIIALRYE